MPHATKWDAPPPRDTTISDWWELYMKDHHFLRVRWRNLHQLDEMMWRSNQPSPSKSLIWQRVVLRISLIVAAHAVLAHGSLKHKPAPNMA